MGKSLMPGLAALIGSVGLVVLPAGSAHADITTPLPLRNFQHVVVDSVHRHLFLSQGNDSYNSILVTDFNGKTVATIGGQTGVDGIALSADGGKLYAALRADRAVSAINTASLKEITRYPLGNSNIPADLAMQSGKVWIGYDDGNGTGGVGEIDPAASTPTFTPQDALGNWSGAPRLAADPSGSGALIATDGNSAASYNVSTDPVTVRVQPKGLPNCGNMTDIAVAPGGGEFVLACGAPYAHYRYRTSDLSGAGSYASNAYPNAVAIDAKGDVAAGISGWYEPDVYVYHSHGDTPLNAYEFGGPEWNLANRGLGWSSDGTKLFAVLQNLNTGALSLRVLNTPALTVSKLTLVGTSSTALGKKVSITGTLSLGVGKPPAGTKVTVVRSLAGSTSTAKFTASVAANGGFTVTDTPKAVGAYTYSAVYAGDAGRAPAQATRKVTITRIPTSLTLTANASTYNYGGSAKVTAHLGTTYTGRTLSIYAQAYGSTTKKLLKKAKVDSHGNLAVSSALTRSTTFSAVFAGDVRYAPVTVTRKVHTRARVSASLSGFYSSKYYGSTKYRVYHHTHTLDVSVTVAPNKKGQCVKLQIQEYYQGGWHSSLTTGCGKLTSTSAIRGHLGLSQATGGRYRVRAYYVQGGSDTSNVSTYGSWLYFSVVK
ncbi:hypothetical protein [Planotetraspora silvatica]